MWIVWAMVGCTVDPLSAAGLAPLIVEAPPQELEIPTMAPASGEDIADGGQVAVADEGSAAAAPPAAEPARFEPISVPMGPRENSVKWKGVSKRGEGRPINMGKGEIGDPGLR
jgi:hypothetical protein